MSSYQFDFFLSYRRSGRGNVRAWVHNHFHGRLLDCLADELPHEPRVFFDVDAEAGVHWPNFLEHALLHTKILIAIWSPQYFQSEWCLAEWRSMLAREQQVGLAARALHHAVRTERTKFSGHPSVWAPFLHAGP